jgi:putative tryptophan/tyrosine transport system substrate-binding protein
MFAEVGGLVFYGSDLIDNYRRALLTPIEFSRALSRMKFELVVNLKTARALNIFVPLPIQQRAHEMIE